MIAYDVDGEPLSLAGGFPARFIDFGLYQYKCVKALRSLVVTRANKIGYWEGLAGYEVDGLIRPKKYYAVDLQKKFYFGGFGEIQDADGSGAA